MAIDQHFDPQAAKRDLQEAQKASEIRTLAFPFLLPLETLLQLGLQSLNPDSQEMWAAHPASKKCCGGYRAPGTDLFAALHIIHLDRHREDSP